MKIKVFFENIVNKIKISGIMDDAKDYIRDNLKMGSVVEVLDKSQDKFYTCPQGYPPEYCTKENIVETFIVRTITDDVLKIKQGFYGLNFEAPCDHSEFEIYNDQGELLYNSNKKEKESIK